MDDLIAGYKRFRAEGWPERQKLFRKLAERGQSPKTMIITCVDSRLDPAMIFDAGPGEILVVRNVANLVPPYEPDKAYHGTSAAIEFGVRVLGVSDIVVLGHGMCGGVRALLEGAPETAQDFIGPWMAMAASARARTLEIAAPEDRQTCCEHEVIKVSLNNLRSFPWVVERVDAGTLRLHGAWYAIESGTLDVLHADGRFESIA